MLPALPAEWTSEEKAGAFLTRIREAGSGGDDLVAKVARQPTRPGAVAARLVDDADGVFFIPEIEADGDGRNGVHGGGEYTTPRKWRRSLPSHLIFGWTSGPPAKNPKRCRRFTLPPRSMGYKTISPGLPGDARRWGSGFGRVILADDGEGEFRAPLADLAVADAVGGVASPFFGSGGARVPKRRADPAFRRPQAVSPRDAPDGGGNRPC